MQEGDWLFPPDRIVYIFCLETLRVKGEFNFKSGQLFEFDYPLELEF